MGDQEKTLPQVLQTLSQTQVAFVAARLGCRSDKEAAELIGIAPSTVYCWSNKADVDWAVAQSTLGILDVGREQLRRLVLKAILVIEKKLDKDSLAAALQVLDRVGLHAVQGMDMDVHLPENVIVVRDRRGDE